MHSVVGGACTKICPSPRKRDDCGHLLHSRAKNSIAVTHEKKLGVVLRPSQSSKLEARSVLLRPDRRGVVRPTADMNGIPSLQSAHSHQIFQQFVSYPEGPVLL